jgi:ADP-heptose:LPS heptosyltransferase
MIIALFSKNTPAAPVGSFLRHLKDFFPSKKVLVKREGDVYRHLEISPHKVSDEKLFYSSFATPGRYLMEMYTRIAGTSNNDEGLLLFNPFFKFDPETTSIVVESIDRRKSSFQIVADRSGTPLGYFFPVVLPESAVKYISLVSCMDAELDRNYLQTAFLSETEVTTIRSLSFSKKDADNGFNYNNNFDRIYAWITDSALKTLQKEYGLSSLSLNLKSQHTEQLIVMRNAIPFTAIMPHHAGDVLFMSIAFNNIESHVTRVIVSDWYSDILRECSPHIEAVPLPLVPTLRHGSTKPDDEYFWDIVSCFPESEQNSSFYYFWRSSREYRICDFHLIDHYAFAMGASFTDTDQFISHRHKIAHFLPPKKGSSYRALLHFEGGWPLKTYQPEFQECVINLLHAKGFEITVLTSRDNTSEKASFAKYKSLTQFKSLLGDHNILIGMDSFPIHYAAHVVGSPAICLFGNTKPVNSDATLSEYYSYLCNEMTCAGCFGFDSCPEYNNTYCKNFPDPEKIVLAATTMLRNLYGE